MFWKTGLTRRFRQRRATIKPGFRIRLGVQGANFIFPVVSAIVLPLLGIATHFSVPKLDALLPAILDKAFKEEMYYE